MTQADWIAVDWGTTHLRCWAMSGATVRDQASSDKGMNALTPDAFEPALLDLVSPWLIAGQTTHVICCGMVGSRQGWAEAPYRSVPCPPADGTLVTAPAHDPRLSVHLIPGLMQATPADVMRGEETQIAGFRSLNPGWDGVICLPGTHTKWVHISAGEVVSFSTFMTGEMFALLQSKSVLRHSVDGDGWDDTAFLDALSDSLSRPEQLAARLFRLRAAHLLDGTGNDTARAQLSGLLIGAELAATKPYWLGQHVAVIGSGTMARAYLAALGTQGINAVQTKADAATLAGLVQAHKLLEPAE